jgi:hypothetical protein
LEQKRSKIIDRSMGEKHAQHLWHGIKQYFEFCEEQSLSPLATTATTISRYITWIGKRGTIHATSLQPDVSTVNGFLRDHGVEQAAQGDLVGKVRR